MTYFSNVQGIHKICLRTLETSSSENHWRTLETSRTLSRTLETSSSKNHWRTSICDMTYGKDEVKTVLTCSILSHKIWDCWHSLPQRTCWKKGQNKKKKRIENWPESTLLQLSSLPDRDDIKSVFQLEYLSYCNSRQLSLN